MLHCCRLNRCHLNLRLRYWPSRHGFMALRAQFHRCPRGWAVCLLGMTLGRAMANLAGDALVVAGGPLRAALGVAAVAIARSLVDGFLGGDLRNRVGPVVTEAVERIDRKQRYGDRRDHKTATIRVINRTMCLGMFAFQVSG